MLKRKNLLAKLNLINREISRIACCRFLPKKNKAGGGDPGLSEKMKKQYEDELKLLRKRYDNLFQKRMDNEISRFEFIHGEKEINDRGNYLRKILRMH